MTIASDTSINSFSAFAHAAREQVDETLHTLLPSSETVPLSVHQAMRWSVFAGGKRFRPLLLLATGETFGANAYSLLRTAAAVELVHTYSLIHDDLPSMDDDDLRRGQPTCHVKFGEATAILAGDALQTLAFQTVAETEELSLTIRIQLISEIARAAGTPAGMVAGQALDLEAEAKAGSFALKNFGDTELQQIHRLKTGALIIAAARCGALIAEASRAELDAVTEYASHLGLLFQITDDLLDFTATAEALGKTPGKDARASKATYATAFGIEAARSRAREEHKSACKALEKITRPTIKLRTIVDYILDRSA